MSRSSLAARSAPVILVVVLLGVAGCSSADLPTPSAPAATPALSESAAASESPSPAVSPTTDDVPSPDAAVPPAASLTVDGTDTAPLAGALGTSSWDGLVSDGPWVIPSESSDVMGGAPLGVAFDPAIAAGSWTARWARVVKGQAGDVAAADEGTGPIAITAPKTPGSWSLQVEARFGVGRSAAWYWRFEVTP